MTLDSITSHIHLGTKVATDKTFPDEVALCSRTVCRERAPDKHEMLLKEEVSARDMKGKKTAGNLALRTEKGGLWYE